MQNLISTPPSLDKILSGFTKTTQQLAEYTTRTMDAAAVQGAISRDAAAAESALREDAEKAERIRLKLQELLD